MVQVEKGEVAIVESLNDSRASARRGLIGSSLVEENQAAFWALKSPMTMVGSWGSNRRERSGRKWEGQDEGGGM